MTEISVSGICAVIVSYQPDLAAIADLLGRVMPQVGAVALVDNASGGDWQAAIGELLAAHGGALLGQPRNIGLAAAQNVGIDWARARGFRHVLLLDQDSEPGADMVAALWRALQVLSAAGKVAAVGPRFHDPREHRDAPFVRIGFPLNRKQWCAADTPSVACDFLISSGMLIPLAVLDRVGPMDAGLFIDNVDLEWGFRARAQGYALHGVCAATMYHRLGDGRRALPFGRGRIVVHGSLRLYYMMRNRLLLYRLPHTPRTWVAQDLPRVLAKLFLFGVLVGPRWRNLRCMLRGLHDGLRGRRGACPDELSGYG
ncbi:glycosyl transferase family 2 [Rhodanobacter thiooxydans]|uniref:Glycosyl transferase family 2 n=1 Tax=Rhodanobacter thiooxydans TaxID=416169 RepID=A0A154QKF0_9GAMM|nr:glycosyltransferase family 2 protein [Rhodanobacter thiooxydans]KZC24501.1 glycosyl transferase family 2 [Rhodanobacter thiooxydans]